MKLANPARPLPPQNPVQVKIQNVARQNKLSGAEQGTTRVLWDSIALDGSAQLEFFKNPQTAINALGSLIGSNVDNQQGLLGAGETFAITFVSFSVFTYNPATKVVGTFETVANSGIAGFEAGFYAGTFAFQLETAEVMKPVSNQVFLPEFNPTPGAVATLSQYRLMIPLVLTPYQKFSVQVAVPTYTAAANTWLRCTLMGEGGILSMKNPQ